MRVITSATSYPHPLSTHVLAIACHVAMRPSTDRDADGDCDEAHPLTRDPGIGDGAPNIPAAITRLGGNGNAGIVLSFIHC